MSNSNPQALPCLPFSQIYERNIASKLKEIDIFLKTTSPPYNIKDVSDLLHISSNELVCMMENKNIPILNILSFFIVVQTSSSYICQLIQREWEYYNIKYYTPEIIAYIYELNQDKVALAFKQSGLSQVESHNIKELFSYISVPVMNL